jgi:hypothetical protein
MEQHPLLLGTDLLLETGGCQCLWAEDLWVLPQQGRQQAGEHMALQQLAMAVTLV